MRNTFIALPLLALAATATPAIAQDRDSHFDGPYVSGIFGGALQNSDINESVSFDTNGDGTFGDTVRTTSGANAFSPGFCNGSPTSTGPVTGCVNDKDGFEYGGRIGYDSRMGNFVGGVLLEVTGNGISDATTAFSTTPASYTLSREIDYAVSLRGRLGFTPGGGALFYATGGASYAKIGHTLSTTNTANTFTPNDKDMAWGYQAGGGAEVMLSDNVSLGLEYLYNKYADKDYRVVVTQGSAPSTNPFIQASSSTVMAPANTKFDFHSVRATLNFQF